MWAQHYQLTNLLMAQGTKRFTITELKGYKPELVQNVSSLFQLYPNLEGGKSQFVNPG